MFLRAAELSALASSSVEHPNGVQCQAASPVVTNLASAVGADSSRQRILRGESPESASLTSDHHADASTTTGSALSENGRLTNRSPRMSLIGTHAKPSVGYPAASVTMRAWGVNPYVSQTDLIQGGEVKRLPCAPLTSVCHRGSVRGSANIRVALSGIAVLIWRRPRAAEQAPFVPGSRRLCALSVGGRSRRRDEASQGC
jgi:hypothetical protein